jgi:alpha-amylase
MMKTLFMALVFAAGALALSSCATGGAPSGGEDEEVDLEFRAKPPLEGAYGVYYEIFVASFYDSNGDGVGDLRGIIDKLDYLNNGNLASSRSLHVDGLWLMPVMPSPSYHKYDVTDYCAIDPAYGTMEDFEELVRECKSRGMKVIIDLVVNHTSSRHPWFRAALEELRTGAPPKYADYYCISDTRVSSKYYPAGVRGKYYEAEFWDQMPDLNYDSPELRKEFQGIVDFWLEKGAAGFRLDAVKYVYSEPRKGVEFLAWFTDYCRSKKPDVYLVGEVWDTAAAILSFYESGIPSLFNFTFAQQKGLIPQAVAAGSGANFATVMANWNKLIKEKNPGAIDAPFLSNHDHDRSAGYFNQDPVREKMAAALYLLMPGNPFIYYGEEIGMTGSGEDENKRGPMIWSVQSRKGQTRGPPYMNHRWNPPAGAAEQLGDPASLLRFYVEALRLRSEYPLMFYGSPEEIKTGDRAIAAYRLRDGGGEIGIVHNLGADRKTLELPGASRLGGALAAGGALPSLKGETLELPGHSSAVLEF